MDWHKGKAIKIKDEKSDEAIAQVLGLVPFDGGFSLGVLYLLLGSEDFPIEAPRTFSWKVHTS